MLTGKPARRVGEGQERKGGVWRARERMSGLIAAAQDTFYVGNMKGVGRHLPADLHRHLRCKVAFAKLYDRKTCSIAAADLLNDRVVPFYDAHEVKLCRVLTDRGTEYCRQQGCGQSWSIMNMSSTWRSRMSITRAPRPKARKRMELLNGSTRPCSTSSTRASPSARKSSGSIRRAAQRSR